MKKAIYLLSIVLIAACTAEPQPMQSEEKIIHNPNDVFSDIPSQITAIINDDITKTDYDANGEFSWTNTDEVRLLVYRDKEVGDNSPYKWKWLNYFSYANPTLSDNNRIATFGALVNQHIDGYDNWKSTGYAVYPPDIAGTATGNTTGCALVVLSETPNGSISQTPLIGTFGKMGENDAFLFHNATGVIAITLNNIPSYAKKLVLKSTGSYNICGAFTIDNDDEIPQIKTSRSINNKGNKLTIDISSISGSHTFYIPMPVGEIPAETLVIELYDTDDIRLMSKKVKPALSIVRSELLAIPALTVLVENDINATISGTTSSTKLSFSFDDSRYDEVRYGNAQNWYNSYASIPYTTSGQEIDITNEYSIRRTIGWAGYKNGVQSTVVSTCYYYPMNSTDSGKIIGSFVGSAHSETGEGDISTMRIDFAATDDVSKGNVVVTRAGDVEATSSVYGYFNGSSVRIPKGQIFATFSTNDQGYDRYSFLGLSYPGYSWNDIQFSISDGVLSNSSYSNSYWIVLRETNEATWSADDTEGRAVPYGRRWRTLSLNKQ